jgi:cytochrome c
MIASTIRAIRPKLLQILAQLVVLCCAQMCAHPFAVAGDTSASQLAADRGCYNCHAEPSRRGVRAFAEIRSIYAQQRANPNAQMRAVERLRRGSLFSHIAAHERLSEEEAVAVVRWLFAGTP